MKCTTCGQSQAALGAPMQRCSVCKWSYHCNRQCQRKDWKHHGQLCEPPKSLMVNLRLMSGQIHPMSCLYDDTVTKLENRVLEWLCQMTGADPDVTDVNLALQDQIMDHRLTLREHGIVDGVELSVISSKMKPCPTLANSSSSSAHADWSDSDSMTT